ncbi:MAG: hypothetical protein WCI11_16040, partial [Candidatus Methylumidiphilus sp.]
MNSSSTSKIRIGADDGTTVNPNIVHITASGPVKLSAEQVEVVKESKLDANTKGTNTTSSTLDIKAIQVGNSTSGITIGKGSNVTESSGGKVTLETSNSGVDKQSGNITVESGATIDKVSSLKSDFGDVTVQGTVNTASTVATASTVSARGILQVDGTVEDKGIGDLTVEAVTGPVNVNGLLKSTGDLSVTGNASSILTATTGSTQAGKNLNVTGALNSKIATAALNLNVTGGTLTTENATATGALAVTGGGGILRDQGGDLTVTGNAVLVSDSGKITSSSTNGNLKVEATGLGGNVPNPDIPEIWVKSGGSIEGNNKGVNKGDMSILAPNGSIRVENASRIYGNNTGLLTVTAGDNAAVNIKGGEVSVLDGGVIEKALGTDLNVTANNIIFELPSAEPPVGLGHIKQTGGTGSLSLDSKSGGLSFSSIGTQTGDAARIIKINDGNLTLKTGGDFTALGNLTYSKVGDFTVHGQKVIVDGGNVNGVAAIVGNNTGVGNNVPKLTVTADSTLTLVNGGIIQKSAGGDLVVKGGAITFETVPNQFGQITHTGAPGNMTVETTTGDMEYSFIGSPGNPVVRVNKYSAGDLTLKAGGVFRALGSLSYSQAGNFNIIGNSVVVDGTAPGVQGTAEIVSKSGTQNFKVEATGADLYNPINAPLPSSTALTVIFGGRIVGDNAGEMKILASNANGTVNVSNSGTVKRTSAGTLEVGARTVFVNGLLKSDAGDVTVALNSALGLLPAIFNTNTGTTSAGNNVNVTGVLNSGTTSAGDVNPTGGNVVVNGVLNSGITTAKSTTALNGNVTVSEQNATLRGGTAVTATNQLLVDGGGTLTNSGNLTAQGASVLVGGAGGAGSVVASNAGWLSLLATGTVTVDGGTINGANTGNTLYVGQDQAGVNVAKLVQVINGGVVERTANGDLTVKAQSVLVDTGGTIIAGNPSDANVKPTGAFTVEATAADGAASASALTVGANAQIIGRNVGDMTVQATNPQGSVDVKATGKITGTNGGEATVFAARDVNVEGEVGLANTGTATVRAVRDVKVAGTVKAENGSWAEVWGGNNVTVDNGTITGANSSNPLYVGQDHLGASFSPLVQIINGGVINRTNNGDLNVTAKQIQFAGGGQIKETGVAGNGIINNLTVNNKDAGLSLGSIGSDSADTTSEIVKSTNGNLTLKTDGDYTIKANQSLIYTKTGDFNIAGNNVNINGLVKGDNDGNLTVTANSALQVSAVGTSAGTIEKTKTGDLTVEAKGNDTVIGQVVNEALLVGDKTTGDKGTITFSSTGLMNVKASNAVKGTLRVTAGGTIERATPGTLSLYATDVHVDGNVSSTGDIIIDGNGKGTVTLGQEFLSGSNSGVTSSVNGSLNVTANGHLASYNIITSQFNPKIEGNVNYINLVADSLIVNNKWGYKDTREANKEIIVTSSGELPVGSLVKAGLKITVEKGGVINGTCAVPANCIGNTDLVIFAPFILVDGNGSKISKTSPGNLTVEATGSDGTDQATSKTPYALTVSNGGQILGDNNSGSVNVFADLGTVNVDGGKITGNNNGPLNIGYGANYQTSLPVTSKLVYVHNQGVIEKPADGSLTVKGQGVLVEDVGSKIIAGDSTNPSFQPVGDFNVVATSADEFNLDPKNVQQTLKALTVRNGGQIVGNDTGVMTVLANAGSIEVAGQGSAITGANTGILQVGDVAPGANPAVDTQLVSVTAGGKIEKTAGAGLTVKAEKILVQGTGQNTQSAIDMASTATGDLLVEATGGGLTVGQTALTVGGFGNITLGNTGAMRLLASNLTGAVEVASGGTVERKSDGLLEVNARTVFVNGLLKSDLGDLTVSGNGTLGEFTPSTEATTGIATAGKNLTVTGALNAQTATAAANLNVIGGTLTTEAATATGALAVTGGGTLRDQGGGLTVTGGSVRVGGANSNISSTSTAGNFLVEATGADGGAAALRVDGQGRIHGANTGDMLVLADQGTIEVAGQGSAITGANTGILQ